ncbi:hypothetical protein APC62_13995 [Acinetobacter pittii]|uniref:dual OB domain-containing protein n=1 Tax=Acinetobacter pittii TaxID=48296 RepID=UPI00070D1409|nr:hypothetical protein [Acinetobacter pittii]KRI60528.1 hypothetical protein APC62_13995 [Acinetobacter pittii]
MGIASNVIILSRTKMSGDKICVGGYCLAQKKYVRLLSNTAQALHVDEPYQIGEIYEIQYSPRYSYQIDAPHVEDIAVYEKKYLQTLNSNDLINKVVTPLCIGPLHIKNLFESTLKWKNDKGYILKSAIPSSSVVIVRLSHILEKKQSEDSFSYTDRNLFLSRKYAVKYVGEEVLNEDVILQPGTPIRFSLARWWDGNGNFLDDQGSSEKRSYLQLSGFYL